MIINHYCAQILSNSLTGIKKRALYMLVSNRYVLLKSSFSMGNCLLKNDLKLKMDLDVIYSTVLEEYKHNILKLKEESIKESHTKRKLNTLLLDMPLSVQKIIKENKLSNNVVSDEEISSEKILLNNDHKSYNNFPFGKFQNFNAADSQEIANTFEDGSESFNIPEDTVSIKDDILYRLKTYKERKRKNSYDSSIADPPPKIYEDFLLTDVNDDSKLEVCRHPTYGTPNPEIEPSSVPCGGCGALLHCQDESLPGYMPSELFKDKNKGELRSSLCQRCFFLEKYDVALNVRVSPDVYEKSLQPITSDKALIIIVVDIIDVPCSIWPGFFKLLGPHRPIFIVGNKVDLLPPDSPNYLVNAKKSLLSTVKKTNLVQGNIKHCALVSAKTGYGIEDLISKLQVLWGTKGNIYIVGCTNAGKSTLFNALLGSDMCQIQATDLIKRATTSPWPGTTLNLLKFPLMKPTGERITRRIRRIREEKLKFAEAEPPLKKFTFDSTEATLSGYIGQTFIHDAIQNESVDPFLLNARKSSFVPMGIKDKSYLFKESKWLHDTPGTVQPDQLLGLLTHNELLQVLPKNMIIPRTYSLKIGQSLFLGGIARLDVIFISNKYLRLTVFSSSYLPVTIVNTVNASSFYRNYLGTKLLNVPTGGSERLGRWPPLKPVNVSLISHAPEGESCADIVLSSAGFIAVTGEDEIELRGWTPSGRGVYIRNPPMLPTAVKLKGKKIKGTPAFHKHKLYIPSAVN